MSDLNYPTIASTLTPDFLAKLDEIRTLLAEATEHALACDGHCKSSEGAVSIGFAPFFWREDADPTPEIEIYSYVLGPHRTHYFKGIDPALRAVRAWHRREMEHDCEKNGCGWF